MTQASAIFADYLYDGESDTARKDQLVRIADGRILEITGAGPLGRDRAGIHAKILAPGFIDIQINGAGDVMFNENPSAETIDTIAKAARCGGTAYLLPTFTTAPDQDYKLAIDAVDDALRSRMPGVLGIHLEGPFLSPEKPGIHPRTAIRKLGEKDLEILKASKRGTRLITLAPEETGPGTIEALARAGWIVFAGHSNAGASRMQEAVAEGLRGATHLFNAMSQVTAREPGVAGFVLNTPQLYAGIIADGFHVSPMNNKMAFNLMGPGRLILVSDAMATLAGHCTGFDMSGKAIKLEGKRLIDANGTLAGAHLAMDEAVRNSVFKMGIPVASAIKMASATPAALLRLDAELGKIKTGSRASFTLLDDDLSARSVVIDGRHFQSS